MAEKLTEELLNEISFSSKIDDFVDKVDFEYSLSEYLDLLLKQHALDKKDVIKRSGIETTFGYQIFAGRRKARRNKLLQLAFAMQLSLKEAQRLLNIAGASALYPKNRRDAIIIYCLQSNYDIQKADDILYDYEEESISSM